MSEEEKNDFRSTRQELAFELKSPHIIIPATLTAALLRISAHSFRDREGVREWTNEEVLLDRHSLAQGRRPDWSQ